MIPSVGRIVHYKLSATGYYDDSHPFAVHKGRRTIWLGDPARGEFTPKDKRKRRGKR